MAADTLGLLLEDLAKHVEAGRARVEKHASKLDHLLQTVELAGGGRDSGWSRSVVLQPAATPNEAQLGRLQLGGVANFALSPS